MTHGLDTSVVVASELAGHTRHEASRMLLERLSHEGGTVALAPQVLAEFLHIVTDPRRCTTPLLMSSALERAELIWNSMQVIRVFPDTLATSQFLAWMSHHRLGRKRLLDTLLAATYWSAGIRAIVTLNPADFKLFGCFTVLEP